MKKLVLISTLVFSFLLVAGCGKKTVTVPTDGTTTTTTSTTKVDATKAQCLELVAYGMKVALAQTKGDTSTATKLADEAMTLEKQLNLDNVEYETACGKYMTDPSFVKEIQKLTADIQK